MATLDEKVIRVFGWAAVDKRLARLEVVSRLPRFIAEYLITKYYYSDPRGWVEKLTSVVNEYYPDPRDRDRVLSKAKREGRVTLIDEFEASVDLKRDIYILRIPNLQIYDALVSESIVSRFDRIFTGLWGIGVLEYRPELLKAWLVGRERPCFTPLILTDFEPFQVYNVDVGEFVEGRRAFTTREWVELLIRSIGLNPSMYDERRRLILLTRLAPLVESNVNLLELGPRATGKTYLYRNVSYYTRIYAGGTVSAARLFYDARLKIIGDIGTKDAVIFDEISRVRFTNPDEVVAKLKDYMVDGFFERGQLKRAHSTCSLVFMGNIELGDDLLDSVIDSLPSFMRDAALLDRIHGLLPGWELPKIQRSDEHLASGMALAVDYLSEILHKLRDISFEKFIEQHVELVGNYTIRDEIAVKKLLSALTKLLFPHGEFDREELRAIASLVVELRQNVVNILSRVAPSEFKWKRLDARVRG